MERSVINFIYIGIIATITFLICQSTYGVNQRQRIVIVTNHPSTKVGNSICITARLTPYNLRATQLWPYVNGRQWGAPEETNRIGQANFILPLPLSGWTTIRVSTSGPETTPFPVGHLPPRGANMSNNLTIYVHKRRFAPTHRKQHLIGIEYESWWRTWNLAEAIPLIGLYAPNNKMVIRQHALWFDQMGINYILIDWSFMLNSCPHNWNPKAIGVSKMITSTNALCQTYARMRQQGIPTPQITMLLGLNFHTMGTKALNQEMHCLYKHYVLAPKLQGIWLYYRGKPLILILNGAGPAALVGKPPISHREFTVRWMGAQLQNCPLLVKSGYWSWMDGSVHPVPVFNNGNCEALTITPAYFNTPSDWQRHGGWLGHKAMGRDNGVTYLREMVTALKYRPHFLNICQWNEFDSQTTGHSYSPGHHIYQDCYSPELSNDIEPTSLMDRGYRGHGGWGFYYLNLTRAFIHLYHQKHPTSTILAIGSPHRRQVVKTSRITVRWACVGKAPMSFTLWLDGKVVARRIPPSQRAYAINLRGVAPGRHTLTLRANGAVSRIEISYARESRWLAQPIPAVAHIAFILSGK